MNQYISLKGLFNNDSSLYFVGHSHINADDFNS